MAIVAAIDGVLVLMSGGLGAFGGLRGGGEGFEILVDQTAILFAEGLVVYGATLPVGDIDVVESVGCVGIVAVFAAGEIGFVGAASLVSFASTPAIGHQ